MASYWTQITSGRVGRRRFIGAVGGASAAAAFLAACGGSSSSSGGEKKSTGNTAVTKPVDTSSSAKIGGVLKSYSAADITHFDALASNSASTVGNGTVFAYTRMLRFKSGV